MNPLARAATVIPVSAQSLLHALGWTLLHFCWQGALVAILLWCILALLGERCAQPRYIAACTALALMAILPLVTFTRLLTASHGGAHLIIVFVPLDPVTAQSAAALQEHLLYRIANAIDRSMPATLAVWFAGVILLLARLSIGLFVARRMKSAVTQQPPHELRLNFHQLARRIGVLRPVQLLHSALVQVPTVIGWLRPVVLIPLGCLSGLSSTQIEALLAHELAHIRRHDYLISVLQSIVEALLFYHPAVWWVSKRIRVEREHCCDDLAVGVGDALTYARALTLLAEQSFALPAIGLGANGGILTMRIKRLLGINQSPAASQLAALTLLGIVIAATAVGIGTTGRAQLKTPLQANPHQTSIIPTANIHDPALVSSNAVPAAIHPLLQQSAVANTATVPSPSSEYQKWIDQDVRWDITPPERTAFLQLPTDEERDHFIEQFWLRHDPPGSPHDTFRTEHYRRIAYANEHFAAGNAGWETDRGHIYIVYGPPNAIANHSVDGRSYEVWRYNSAPGLGQNMELKFIDVCNCGNYQLQSQPASGGSAPSSASTLQVQPSSRVRSAPKPALRQAGYAVQGSSLQSSAAAASHSPLHVSTGIMQGQIVSRVDPIYPPQAKAEDIQGAVVLHVIISENGAVEKLQVISGPEQLRTSAIDAVRQWMFEPYLLNGSPVEVETTTTVNYNLGDSPNSQAGKDERDNAAAAMPLKLGPGITAPRLTYSTSPEYTEEAREQKVSGKVLLKLWVDTNGIPTHVRVIRGLGSGLDEKAVEAVKRYKFTPAMKDGEPVLVELNIELSFKFF
jgi:TonB family protein